MYTVNVQRKLCSSLRFPITVLPCSKRVRCSTQFRQVQTLKTDSKSTAGRSCINPEAFHTPTATRKVGSGWRPLGSSGPVRISILGFAVQEPGKHKNKSDFSQKGIHVASLHTENISPTLQQSQALDGPGHVVSIVLADPAIEDGTDGSSSVELARSREEKPPKALETVVKSCD